MNAARLPRVLLLCALWQLAGCASPTAGPGLAAFQTDGCSLFPERRADGSADWCACCVQHDLAYWAGGTAAQRLQADEALRACVQAASGSAVLAGLMFAGVRIGGGPSLATPFRWGYGWPHYRAYGEPAADEAAQLAARQPAAQATAAAAMGSPACPVPVR